MNRKIKFRALKDDMSNCTFQYGELLYDVNGMPIIVHKDSSGEGFRYTTCIKGTEGQFTGLLDIEDTEVYEGDLLNIGSNGFGFITNEKGKNIVCEVKIYNGDYILFRTDSKLTWGRLSRLKEMLWNCQVVGNVHEPALKMKNQGILTIRKDIAEFMGASEDSYPKGLPKETVFAGNWQEHLDNFNYDTEWLWLMPVVEKIGKDYDIRITWMPTAIGVTSINRPDVSDGEIASMGGKTAIENTFIAVVKFIEWYNTKSVARKKV